MNYILVKILHVNILRQYVTITLNANYTIVRVAELSNDRKEFPSIF